MSRLITLIFSLALVVGMVSASPIPVRHEKVRAQSLAVSHIAIIGDSYTTGSEHGGRGSKGWTTRAAKLLASQGIAITADVEAEGGAGYGAPGNHGNVYEDLTARAVDPDDVLVVFFGSINDQDFDPTLLSMMIYGALQLAKHTAPSAQLLVIGPPWPTADPPGAILRIRDTLGYQAKLAGADFVDPIADGWFVGQPRMIGSDGVHPTDAGHEYMANKIAPLIGARLSTRV